jgi:hypothetical protein
MSGYGYASDVSVGVSVIEGVIVAVGEGPGVYVSVAVGVSEAVGEGPGVIV